MFIFLKIGSHILSFVELLMITEIVYMHSEGVMYKSELNLVFPLRLKEKSDSSCRPLTHEPSYLKQGDLVSHTAMRRASGLINDH